MILFDQADERLTNQFLLKSQAVLAHWDLNAGNVLLLQALLPVCCAPTRLPPQPAPSSDWASTLIITHYHSSMQRHAFAASFVLCGVLATSMADHNAKHEWGLIKPGCGSVLPGTRHFIYSLRRHQAAAAPSRAKAPVDYMQIKMTWVQDVKRRVLFINSSTRQVDAFTESVLTE